MTTTTPRFAQRLVTWMSVGSMFVGAAALAFALLGCSRPEVSIDLPNPKYRQKYIEVLEKQHIAYTIDAKDRIHVAMSMEELEPQVKEFDDWYAVESVKDSKRHFSVEHH